MDATRTEPDYLARVCEIAIKAGATTINIPDTVGYTAPRESAAIIRDLLERVPGMDAIVIATHCHNDLGMATANALAAVEAGARQIECTINGLGERAGNTSLEEVVMAMRVRNDIMPYRTGIDTTRIMQASRLVATVSGFPVQFNKAIVGKNAFAHESGIHQDGMLKHAGTFEIMRPEDVGLNATEPRHGQAFGPGGAARQARGARLQARATTSSTTSSCASRSSPTARRRSGTTTSIALMQDTGTHAANDRIQVQAPARRLRHRGAADRRPGAGDRRGRAPRCRRRATGRSTPPSTRSSSWCRTTARLALYQVHAVTEGTDAQATVSVRLEEDGKIVTGQSADTDTVVASTRAYVNALNKLLVRRLKTAPAAASA